VQSGSLLIDSSTVDPATSQDIETQAASKDAVYMDSPVSGGTLSHTVMCICLIYFITLTSVILAS